MGFIATGDRYTQRMDDAVGPDFEDHRKCTDDKIIWDRDIGSNFHRVCDCLTAAVHPRG